MIGKPEGEGSKKFGLMNRILNLLEDGKAVSREDIIFYFNRKHSRHTVKTTLSYGVRKKYLDRIDNAQILVKISKLGIARLEKSRITRSPWYCPKKEAANDLSIQFYKLINRENRVWPKEKF